MLFGIHAYNLGTFNNTIRRNNFTGIKVANQAGGVNGDSGEDLPRGLYFECNGNTNTSAHDFLICDYDGTTDRIKKSQGLPTGDQSDPYDAAGNTFAYTGTPVDRDFSNKGGEVDYFYSNQNNENPISISGITKFEAPINDCPIFDFSFLFANYQEEIQKKQNYYNNRSAFENTKLAYETALNSGNIVLADQKRAEGDYYQREMDKSAFKVLQNIFYDTINYSRDSMRLWLANLNTYGTEMTLALDYFDDGNETMAFATLDEAPMKLDLSPEQISDLGEVNNLFNLLASNSPRYLAKEETLTLETIAEGAGEYAPGLAGSILQLAGKLRRPRLCGVEGEIGFGSLEANLNVFGKEPKITVYPNPIRNEVFFKLSNAIEQSRIIKIFNLNGRLIDQLEVLSFEKEASWEVNSLSNGIYFYQLEQKMMSTIQGKIVVQK